MNEVFEQLAMALIALAQAIERAGGPKRVMTDEMGNVVGIQPVE